MSTDRHNPSITISWKDRLRPFMKWCEGGVKACSRLKLQLLLVFLLLSLFLRSKLGFLLLFPFAFVFLTCVTHDYFSLVFIVSSILVICDLAEALRCAFAIKACLP